LFLRAWANFVSKPDTIDIAGKRIDINKSTSPPQKNAQKLGKKATKEFCYGPNKITLGQHRPQDQAIMQTGVLHCYGKPHSAPPV